MRRKALSLILFILATGTATFYCKYFDTLTPKFQALMQLDPPITGEVLYAISLYFLVFALSVITALVATWAGNDAYKELFDIH